MKNRFLITGATGFVGSNIVRSLVNKGEIVSVVVRDKKLSWRLKDIASKIHTIETDILNPSLGKIVEKIRPDYIFHLAAYGVLPHETDVRKMIDVNIKGTMNLIQAVKKNPFKLFINTGTSVEYGIKNTKMQESQIISPINDYGVTKAAATLYCQKEGVRSNLPIINFRLFTPYGYFEDINRLIPAVILSAIKNEPIYVSVPTSVRDFIFIDDIVDSYLRAIKTNFDPGEIINIGSGKEHFIEEVVSKTLEITKSRSKVEWGSVKQQERFIEPKKWEANISKARKILQWEPTYTLGQGLKETIAWFKQNQNLYRHSNQ